MGRCGHGVAGRGPATLRLAPWAWARNLARLTGCLALDSRCKSVARLNQAKP